MPAVFLGHVTTSKGVTPRGRLSASGGLSMKASVSAELSVPLVSTSTGGTLAVELGRERDGRPPRGVGRAAVGGHA